MSKKKVLVALRMAGICGQEKLAGIFDWLGSAHNWEITLVRTAQEFTPDCVRAAIRAHYDGFIVSIPSADEAAALLADSSIPTIVIDIHTPELSARTKNIVFIRNSAESIGSAAADFLVSTGRCRSYAYVHNPSVLPWSVNRFHCFREALRDRGLWCHEFKSPEGLQDLQRPVGIFAANDDTGFATLAFCQQHRMAVSEQALVLGVDNDTLICENASPRLSSLMPDFKREGYLAAEALDRMMRQPNKPTRRQASEPQTLLVGVKEIVRRESTAEISLSGKLVQKGVAYIQKNALKGISVRDVVQHLGCSRRLADLRFRELQKTSIGEAIIAMRLAEVKRLLATTRDPISAIGPICGYENANHLKNLFKRRFGMSMRDYRTSCRG